MWKYIIIAVALAACEPDRNPPKPIESATDETTAAYPSICDHDQSSAPPCPEAESSSSSTTDDTGSESTSTGETE